MKKKCLFNSIMAVFLMASCVQSVYAESDENAIDYKTQPFTYKAQNPLAPVYSVPLSYTYHGGANQGGVNIGSLQPIIPVRFKNWNLINQLSLNFIGTSGPVTGIAELPQPFAGSGVYGLGDTNFTSLISPAHSGIFNWGVGPTFVFPTDTLFSDISDRRSRELGSGKFSVGPAVVLVTQPKPWSLGLKVKQVWSVLGNDTRDSVSQMVLQPFVNYNLPGNWYLVSDMDMIANWNYDQNQRWTVPVGAGVGKVFKVGNNAVNTRMEGYYNPVKPDEAPEWSANLTLQFLFGE